MNVGLEYNLAGYTQSTPILKEQTMVAQLAEYFISVIYILGIVLVGSLILNIALATIRTIITSIIEALSKDSDER
jgi:hypothetical protein